jgi:hypothetical protein
MGIGRFRGRELPFLTWASASPRREERIIEIQFPLKALAEWEARKDRLAAVTRSVYKAQIASEDD